MVDVLLTGVAWHIVSVVVPRFDLASVRRSTW
jgi:hypothetical protein